MECGNDCEECKADGAADDCVCACNGCGTDCEECTADGAAEDCACACDETVWDGDGHTDDGTTEDAAMAWGNDGYTGDTTEDADMVWGSDGHTYSTQSSYALNAHDTTTAMWGLGALVACVVGAAVFMVTKKRKRDTDDSNNGEVRQDVYVDADLSPAPVDNAVAEEADLDEPTAIEMSAIEMSEVQSTNKSSISRSSSIKMALARGSMSIKSKLGRSRSGVASSQANNTGDYEAPIATIVEQDNFDNFDNESVSLNQNDGGGVVM